MSRQASVQNIGQVLTSHLHHPLLHPSNKPHSIGTSLFLQKQPQHNAGRFSTLNDRSRLSTLAESSGSRSCNVEEAIQLLRLQHWMEEQQQNQQRLDQLELQRRLMQGAGAPQEGGVRGLSNRIHHLQAVLAASRHISVTRCVAAQNNDLLLSPQAAQYVRDHVILRHQHHQYHAPFLSHAASDVAAFAVAHTGGDTMASDNTVPTVVSKKASLIIPRSTMTSNTVQTPRGGYVLCLPVCLSVPSDATQLSSIQSLLRKQIDAFQATDKDVSVYVRGRSKPIRLGQVGIRCRHCVNLPKRCKGSTYFPTSVWGFYQTAQNMMTTHLRDGQCTAIPQAIKDQFAQELLKRQNVLKEVSGLTQQSHAGRSYWADEAEQLGLVDLEGGVFFIRQLPSRAHLPERQDSVTSSDKHGNSSGVYRSSHK